MCTSRLALIGVLVVGCVPKAEQQRYPGHRKLEEHRIGVLEANAPVVDRRLDALQHRVDELEAMVRDLSKARATDAAP